MAADDPWSRQAMVCSGGAADAEAEWERCIGEPPKPSSESQAVLLMKATVQAGASRQVVAAVAASLWRLASASSVPRELCVLLRRVHAEVESRWSALQPAIAAQVQADLHRRPQHTSCGLTAQEAHARANCAGHAFGVGVPFADASLSELK